MAVQTNDHPPQGHPPPGEDVMMLQAHAKEIAINKVLLKQQASLDRKRVPSGGELVSGLPLRLERPGD